MVDSDETEHKLLKNTLKARDKAFVLLGFRVGAAALEKMMESVTPVALRVALQNWHLY